jgi:hypothetical protein
MPPLYHRKFAMTVVSLVDIVASAANERLELLSVASVRRSTRRIDMNSAGAEGVKPSPSRAGLTPSAPAHGQAAMRRMDRLADRCEAPTVVVAKAVDVVGLHNDTNAQRDLTFILRS